MVRPQPEKLKEFGLPPELAENPEMLFAAVSSMVTAMERKASIRMLQSIYGPGAAAGMYKLITAPSGIAGRVVAESVGPAGFSIEQAEETGRQATEEYKDAQAAAKGQALELLRTPEQWQRERVNRMKGKLKEEMGIRNPLFRLLYDLSGKLIPGWRPVFETIEDVKAGGAGQKYLESEGLPFSQQNKPISINYHYHYGEMQFNPVLGEPITGSRVPNNLA
jgi:hypothetical protein